MSLWGRALRGVRKFSFPEYMQAQRRYPPVLSRPPPIFLPHVYVVARGFPVLHPHIATPPPHTHTHLFPQVHGISGKTPPVLHPPHTPPQVAPPILHPLYLYLHVMASQARYPPVLYRPPPILYPPYICVHMYMASQACKMFHCPASPHAAPPMTQQGHRTCPVHCFICLDNFWPDRFETFSYPSRSLIYQHWFLLGRGGVTLLHADVGRSRFARNVCNAVQLVGGGGAQRTAKRIWIILGDSKWIRWCVFWSSSSQTEFQTSLQVQSPESTLFSWRPCFIARLSHVREISESSHHVTKCWSKIFDICLCIGSSVHVGLDLDQIWVHYFRPKSKSVVCYSAGSTRSTAQWNPRKSVKNRV